MLQNNFSKIPMEKFSKIPMENFSKIPMENFSKIPMENFSVTYTNVSVLLKTASLSLYKMGTGVFCRILILAKIDEILLLYFFSS